MSPYIQKQYKRATILIIIPLITYAVHAKCAIGAVLLEAPTNRGGIYTFLAAIAMICMILMPIPNLVMACSGTSIARKLKQNDVPRSNRLFILGVIVSIVAGATVALGIYIVLRGSQM